MNGPLIVDVETTTLTDDDCSVLLNPWVGGIILFQRNLESVQQCKALIREIRALRPDLLITVDQEGGRVRRLTEGVLNVPPMAKLAADFDDSPERVLGRIRATCAVMAHELDELGFDLTWAPVADLDRGLNEVIGHRAFGADPRKVAQCVQAAAEGLLLAGFCPVLKHFPGHGGVTVDTHVGMAQDLRPLAEIGSEDLVPFRDALAVLPRAGVMLSHVQVPAVEAVPAALSPAWVRYLRETLGFEGPVVTDDLGMQGAGPQKAGDRVVRALSAGADVVLLCNDRKGVYDALRRLDELDNLPDEAGSAGRRARLRKHPAQAGNWDKLKQHVEEVLNGRRQHMG